MLLDEFVVESTHKLTFTIRETPSSHTLTHTNSKRLYKTQNTEHIHTFLY